jgi:hypothetical protein
MAAAEENGRLSARELALAAMATTRELTGFDPEATTRLEWDGELWCVEVDVLELAKIPSTTDIVGRYEVKLDPAGTLRGYRRVARFHRGAAFEEG